jgi:hypothetical protein
MTTILADRDGTPHTRVSDNMAAVLTRHGIPVRVIERAASDALFSHVEAADWDQCPILPEGAALSVCENQD